MRAWHADPALPAAAVAAGNPVPADPRRPGYLRTVGDLYARGLRHVGGWRGFRQQRRLRLPRQRLRRAGQRAARARQRAAAAPARHRRRLRRSTPTSPFLPRRGFRCEATLLCERCGPRRVGLCIPPRGGRWLHVEHPGHHTGANKDESGLPEKPGKSRCSSAAPSCWATTAASTLRRSVVTARSLPSYSRSSARPGQRP